MIRIQGENYRTGVVSLQRSERGLMLGEWNYLFTYFVGSFGIQLLLLGLFVSISMSLLPGVRVDRNRMQVSFKREGKKVELSYQTGRKEIQYSEKEFKDTVQGQRRVLALRRGVVQRMEFPGSGLAREAVRSVEQEKY